uniref:Uncharacterized protein n=4 Tax=Triticinae TaxID=1648030 RepID=A0A453PE80_AEGTS
PRIGEQNRRSTTRRMSLSPAPEESYARLGIGFGFGRRWRRARGFRLGARNRFSVRRLRAKLLTFIGLVGRHARHLARRISRRGGGSCPWSGSARTLVGGNGSQRWCPPGGEAAAKKQQQAPRRAASFMRTNSFYAQAIAECLEFIKRNSVPVEDYGSAVVARGGGAVGR